MRTLRGSCCLFTAGMRAGCLILLLASGAGQAASDLRVSATAHYLEKSDGTPFFLLSDTEWLLNNHSDAQVLQILDDRRAKGFTVVQVFATRNWSQTDANGNLPFINNDPAQLNPAYWDRWRWVADRAAERGLHFLLIYGEPGRKENPWMCTTNAACYAYGRRVGDYFKDKGNIIFCNGQDSDANGGVGAAGWRAMAEGVADGVNGQNNYDGQADYSTTLMTYHGYSIYETFQQDAWIDFYGQEVWHNNGAVYDTVNRGYNLTNPVKPIALLEGTYENEAGGIFPGNATPYYVRVEAWHAYFAGGTGYGYGHCRNWQQYTDVAYLDDPAAQQMAVLASLLNPRSWWLLAPDAGLIASGAGSGSTRVVGLRSSAGSECLVYFPTASTAGIRMDRITTSASVNATWRDPRSGASQSAGSYTNSQTVSLTPPAGWEDALLVLQAGTAPPPPAAGPVGHWKLDDGSGTTATDSSGNNNHGSLVNGPAWTGTGKLGGALGFDGQNDYVSVPSSSTIDSAQSQLTIALWIYKRANASNWGLIAGRRWGTGYEDLWNLLYDNSASDDYLFAVRTGSSVTVRGPSSNADVNNWVHLAGTYDGSTVRLYRNGAEVASAPLTGTLPSESSPLVLGAGDNGTHGIAEYVNAILDDVRLYNRALSASEIHALATVTDTQAPTVPGNLTVVSKTSGSVSLSWTAATDNVGVTAYDVLRNGAVAGSSTGLSYTDTGLAASTTYTYTVKARDAAGNVSAASNTVSATTDAASTNVPIALHPNNGHYFLFRNKTTVLVTSGEHYGAVINLDFDYIPYLNELQAKGLNLTRTWAGPYCEAYGNFGIQGNTLAPAAGRFICPWARSSTPGYANGGNKFDLDQWDAAYFARLKGFVAQAGARGVVVELTLFCPFYDDSQWNLSPMKASNNINGIGTVGRNEAHTLANGNLMAMQEAYVRKVVSELRDYDNVVYEICNEPYFGGVTLDWQARIADIVTDAESSFANKHLLTQNIANGSTVIGSPNAKVSVFNFHYCRPPDAVAQNYALNKVIGNNETGFDGSADVTYRTQGWDLLVAGGALYNNLDYSFTPDAENGTAVPNAPGGGSATLRTQLGILKRFLDGFTLTAMAPNNALIQGGVPSGATARALAEPGKQYAIYVNGGTQASLGLNLPAGSYRAEWLNTKTGAVDKSEDLTHTGGTRTVASPAYTEDIALRITGSATQPPAGSYLFYRAINLNGVALTIDGNAWEGKDAPNYSFDGSSFENQSVTLNPATDANRATMIRSSIWNRAGSNVTVSAVPNGSYRVYLYVWEDNASASFDISLEGQIVQAGYASGAGGHWDKLGPWDATISDGTISVACSAGDANLSGIEIWRASTVPPGAGSGTIRREVWTSVSGTGIAQIPLATAPALVDQLTSFEAPTNWADNYGTRVRGYVHPPVSGAYTFWLATDDDGELWLSSDENPANKTRIASVTGWTNSREWGKYASQQSVAVNLTTGQKYYVEALQKEGGGGDNLAVAWQGPGLAQAVIEGQYLSPYVPAPPPGTGIGLTGQYFDNADFTSLKVTRTDATVNFDWGSGSPDASLGADTFSVRWTGQVEAAYTETHTFYTNTDDGVRLWINGQLVVDKWVDQGPTEWSGTIALVAGQKYDLKMEYYENGGGAVAKLWWSSASTPKAVVPQERLYPAVVDSSDPLADVTSVVLKGTADGTGSAVQAVRVRVNGGAYSDATLTNGGANWEKEAALVDGTNTIEIRTEDAAGNSSLRTVTISK